VFFLFLTPVKMVLGVPPTGIVKEIPTQESQVRFVR